MVLRNPSFFEIFEALTFIYIFILALWIFLVKEKPKENTIIILITIGLIGLFINLLRLILS